MHCLYFVEEKKNKNYIKSTLKFNYLILLRKEDKNYFSLKLHLGIEHIFCLEINKIKLKFIYYV